jgi:hypothetical protein
MAAQIPPRGGPVRRNGVGCGAFVLGENGKKVMTESRKGSRPEDPESASEHGAGRVVHDERGNAVWNWAKEIGRSSLDSTSALLKKLNIADLKIEGQPDEAPMPPAKAPSEKAFAKPNIAREPGGGYDPYDRNVAAKKPTAPAGPVGKPQFKPQPKK